MEPLSLKKTYKYNIGYRAQTIRKIVTVDSQTSGSVFSMQTFMDALDNLYTKLHTNLLEDFKSALNYRGNNSKTKEHEILLLTNQEKALEKPENQVRLTKRRRKNLGDDLPGLMDKYLGYGELGEAKIALNTQNAVQDGTGLKERLDLFALFLAELCVKLKLHKQVEEVLILDLQKNADVIRGLELDKKLREQIDEILTNPEPSGGSADDGGTDDIGRLKQIISAELQLDVVYVDPTAGKPGRFESYEAKISFTFEFTSTTKNAIVKDLLSDDSVSGHLINSFEKTAQRNSQRDLVSILCNDLITTGKNTTAVFYDEYGNEWEDGRKLLAEQKTGEPKITGQLFEHFLNAEKLAKKRVPNKLLLMNLLAIYLADDKYGSSIVYGSSDVEEKERPGLLFRRLAYEEETDFNYKISEIIADPQKGKLKNLKSKPSVDAVRKKAEAIPLFGSLLSRSEKEKYRNLFLRLLEITLTPLPDEDDYYIEPPLSACQKEFENDLSGAIAAQKLYISRNAIYIVLGYFATAGVFDENGSPRDQTHFQISVGAAKGVLKKDAEEKQDSAWKEILQDALDNFDIVCSDGLGIGEGKSGRQSLPQPKTKLFNALMESEDADNEFSFKTKIIRLYYDAIYQALRCTFLNYDTDKLYQFLIEDKFITLQPKVSEHLDHMKLSLYEDSAIYGYFFISKLPELVRVQLIEKIRVKILQDTAYQLDTELRPIYQACIALFSFYVVETSSVNITKRHFEDLLKAVFGPNAYPFQQDVVRSRLCKSKKRCEFIIKTMLDSLLENQPPLFVMYSGALKDNEKYCKQMDRILTDERYSIIPQKSLNFMADCDSKRAQVFKKSLKGGESEEIANFICGKCYSYRESYLKDKDKGSNKSPIDIRLQSIGVNLLGYLLSNVDNKFLEYVKKGYLPDIIHALILSDYVIRKSSKVEVQEAPEQLMVRPMCGAIRAVSAHNFHLILESNDDESYSDESYSIDNDIAEYYIDYLSGKVSPRDVALLYRLLNYASTTEKFKYTEEELEILKELGSEPAIEDGRISFQDKLKAVTALRLKNALLKEDVNFLVYDHISDFKKGDFTDENSNLRKFLEFPCELQTEENSAN